jgi:hypothetical protein
MDMVNPSPLSLHISMSNSKKEGNSHNQTHKIVHYLLLQVFLLELHLLQLRTQNPKICL